METKLKILISLIIPFAFFCAGIYHIAFWKTFNINGLEYLDTIEIITSFIHPFLYYSMSSVLIQLFIHITTSLYRHTKPVKLNADSIDKNQTEESQTDESQAEENKPSLNWTNFKLNAIRIIGYVYLVITIIFTFQKSSLTKDVVLAFVYLPAIIYVVSMALHSLQIKNISKHLITISIYISILPTLAYVAGRSKALVISKNFNYSYSVNAVPGDTLKYLGKANDSYLFTNLNNTKTHVIKTSSIKNLELFTINRGD